MSSQRKRSIKIVSINDEFFNLFQDDSDKQMLLIKKEMNRRHCLILLKIKFNGLRYTFVLPFRSNINEKAPQDTYFALPPRGSTKLNHHHGLHYIKAFPIADKYFNSYCMRDDFQGEYCLAFVEKNIKNIIAELQTYIDNYACGNKRKFAVNIENAIKKQGL